MNRSLFQNLAATLTCGLCLAAVPVSAAGLLGERYLAVGYDQVFTESDAYENGYGANLYYNHPLSDTVDLGGSYKYATYGDSDGRDEVGDFSDQRFQVMATVYGMPELDRIWVRVGTGIGMVEHADEDETNLSWVAMAGTEYTLGERGVLHPYFGWSDVLDDGESTRMIYGVQIVFDVTEKLGVNFRVEGDHHYNFALTIGGLMRF